MFKKMRAIGGVLLVSALTATACSDDPKPADASNDGGAGGDPTITAGQGGSSTQAGSSSKGGTAGDVGEAGAGGQGGGQGPDCPGCPSGFCLEDGTCLDCVPSDDQCPLGQYCSDANECVPGCKNDATSCASGKCGEDRNCEQCINDDECIGDDVCHEGQCGAACAELDEGQPGACDAGLVCCSLHCIELETNSNHCGVCGNSCADGQFCGASGAGQVTCFDTAIASLCAFGKVIVILDTTVNANEGNRTPGREIGAAIGSTCPTAPIVEEAEQDSVDALNFTTGRPVSGGGELLLVAGGPFFQHLEGYVEEQGISPLYLVNDPDNDAQEFRRRSDDGVVVARTLSGDHESEDFFIIQFMRDAESGSLVLNVQGFWLSGTTAASLLMTTGILPNLASYDQAWYAYKWTDGNDDQLPSLDEIALQASGS